MGESSGARSALHQTLSERAPLRTDTATSAEKERARSVRSFGAFAISYQPREQIREEHHEHLNVSTTQRSAVGSLALC